MPKIGSSLHPSEPWPNHRLFLPPNHAEPSPNPSRTATEPCPTVRFAHVPNYRTVFLKNTVDGSAQPTRHATRTSIEHDTTHDEARRTRRRMPWRCWRRTSSIGAKGMLMGGGFSSTPDRVVQP
jgi:hypothetical protein